MHDYDTIESCSQACGSWLSRVTEEATVVIRVRRSQDNIKHQDQTCTTMTQLNLDLKHVVRGFLA
jgi:hypothetical protein